MPTHYLYLLFSFGTSESIRAYIDIAIGNIKIVFILFYDTDEVVALFI